MNQTQEIKEAITAGEQALENLKMARKALESAGSWGLVDMVAGGMFSTFIKQSKIEGAKTELECARLAVRRFERELQDVDRVLDIKIEIGSFLSFADIFFDNFFVDWMVQSKIEQAGEQVEQAISYIEDILGDLRVLMEK